MAEQNQYTFEITVDDKVHMCKQVPVDGKNYSKFINQDNEVAVIYSPGYGGGFYTNASDDREQLLFDSRLIRFINGEYNEFQELKNEFNHKDKQQMNLYKKFLTEILGLTHEPYPGGFYQLDVDFIPVGTSFRINEYDGSESIEIYNPRHYVIA